MTDSHRVMERPFLYFLCGLKNASKEAKTGSKGTSLQTVIVVSLVKG